MQGFYTVDDGKTWFKDSIDRVPPFDHDGKAASRVFVFSSDGGKTPFAGYLQRFDSVTKKQLDASPKTPRSDMIGTEVKKPNTSEAWVPRNSKAGNDVTANVVSPKGPGDVEPVEP